MEIKHFPPFKLGLFKRCMYYETDCGRYSLLLDCQGGELNLFCQDKETDSSCLVILGRPWRFRKEYFQVKVNGERFHVRYKYSRVVFNFKNYTCASTEEYPAHGMGNWAANTTVPWDNAFDDMRY